MYNIKHALCISMAANAIDGAQSIEWLVNGFNALHTHTNPIEYRSFKLDALHSICTIESNPISAKLP